MNIPTRVALPPLNGFVSEWLVYLGLFDAAADRFDPDDIVIINLSGRGDKDVAEVSAMGVRG